jgi:acyl-CoA dehydrogenase
MSWDFATDPEFDERLRWARGFLDAEILPLEVMGHMPGERAAIISVLQDEVKAAGLWAPHLDPELGGQGFGQLKLGLLHEILGRSRPWGPIVFGCGPPDSGNSEILARHGTELQKERWLEPLLAGEMSSAYAMTEPGAGADPTMLATRARRDGDGWILDGDKWFITNAAAASFMIVMAVTDPDAAPHQRATQFIVPSATPGLEVVRVLGSMENPGARLDDPEHHAEVTLRSVRVADDAMLGPLGGGFAVAQERLGPGRIHHSMRWLGQARRALDMLCERALSRQAQGGLLADKQTIRNWIADSEAELHAARLMTLHAAWKIDTHGAKSARREISMIKYFGPRVLHDVIDRALQIHGSLGYSTDMPIEFMYRDARASRLYDGPDEVHREAVARQVLREFEAVVDGVPSEHVPTRRRAAEQRWAAGDGLWAAARATV